MTQPSSSPAMGTGSRPQAHPPQHSSPVPHLPPVDEVCRILARVLARVQSGGPSDTPVVPEVS